MNNEPAKQATASAVKLPSSKRGTRGFFAEVKRELKKVDWPTVSEANQLTRVVLIVCVAITTGLLLLSSGLDEVVHIITTGGVR